MKKEEEEAVLVTLAEASALVAFRPDSTQTINLLFTTAGRKTSYKCTNGR